MRTKLLWTGFALALLAIMASYAVDERQERLKAEAGAGPAGYAFNPGDHWPEFLEELELRELGQK